MEQCLTMLLTRLHPKLCIICATRQGCLGGRHPLTLTWSMSLQETPTRGQNRAIEYVLALHAGVWVLWGMLLRMVYCSRALLHCIKRDTNCRHGLCADAPKIATKLALILYVLVSCQIQEIAPVPEVTCYWQARIVGPASQLCH